MLTHTELTTPTGKSKSRLASLLDGRSRRLPNSKLPVHTVIGRITAGLIAVGAVGALAVLGGGAPDATAVADEHLHELVSGDANAQYDALCPAIQGRVTRAAFVKAAAVHRAPAATVEVTTTGGDTQADVKFEVAPSKGAAFHGDLTLVKQTDGWHVCSLVFPAPPAAKARGHR